MDAAMPMLTVTISELTWLIVLAALARLTLGMCMNMHI